MRIRQEENTPIGDFFHDSGIRKIFNELYNKVDDFEVDTDELTVYCDSLIASLKSLKAKIKKEESDAIKRITEEKVAGFIQKGGINQ